jgi:hypothetical protein
MGRNLRSRKLPDIVKPTENETELHIGQMGDRTMQSIEDDVELEEI